MRSRIIVISSVFAGLALVAYPSLERRAGGAFEATVPVQSLKDSAQASAAIAAPAGKPRLDPQELRSRTNFHSVDYSDQGFTLFRSARPDRDAIRTWCHLGISEVMVLSGDADRVERRYHDECPGLQVTYNHEQDEHVPVSKQFLQEFDTWVQKAKSEQKKVLFRCAAGAHRTGRLGAYYAMKYQNASLEDATALMIRNGKDMDSHQQLPNQVQALQDYIADKPCRFSGDDAERYCVRE